MDSCIAGRDTIGKSVMIYEPFMINRITRRMVCIMAEVLTSKIEVVSL